MSIDEDRETAGQMEGMVSVGQFESPLEAQMAKGMLESAGIECVLAGEEANSLLQAAFAVGLLVREQDEAAARRLLAEPGGSPESDEASKLN